MHKVLTFTAYLQVECLASRTWPASMTRPTRTPSKTTYASPSLSLSLARSLLWRHCVLRRLLFPPEAFVVLRFDNPCVRVSLILTFSSKHTHITSRCSFHPNNSRNPNHPIELNNPNHPHHASRPKPSSAAFSSSRS